MAALRIRLYADFQAEYPDGEIGLGFVGTQRDLARPRVRLRPGMLLTLYDASDGNEVMEMNGVARYHPPDSGQGGYWYAELDPASFRRVPAVEKNTAFDFPCFHCGAEIYDWLCKHPGEERRCPQCGGLIDQAYLPPDVE